MKVTRTTSITEPSLNTIMDVWTKSIMARSLAILWVGHSQDSWDTSEYHNWWWQPQIRRYPMSKSQQCLNVQETWTMSKYRRNLDQCLRQRNDAPKAIKEDGRNEYHPGKQHSLGKPSATTSFAENSETGKLSRRLPKANTAWRNPMPSTDLPPQEKKGQSSSSSSWRPCVREDSTERSGVRLTPAPKPQ